MPSIVFASNFLAGSLLSLLLPTGLLIAIVVWWTLLAKHVPRDTPTSSSALPPPEVVAAAPPSETGVTPAGSPPGDA